MNRLVTEHFEEFLRVSDERFAPRHDPLRPVVERTLLARLVQRHAISEGLVKKILAVRRSAWVCVMNVGSVMRPVPPRTAPSDR